jgi:hypothetical protein
MVGRQTARPLPRAVRKLWITTAPDVIPLHRTAVRDAAPDRCVEARGASVCAMTTEQRTDGGMDGGPTPYFVPDGAA